MRSSKIRSANPASVAIAAVLALSVGAPAEAAWTNAQDEFFSINELKFVRSDGFYDDDGEKRSGDRVDSLELATWMTYGLTDSVTLLATGGYKFVENRDSGGSSRGLTKVGGGARVRLWEGDGSVFSLQGLLELNNPEGRKSTYLGDDAWSLETTALFGHSFDAFGIPSFVASEVGPKFYFGKPSDELVMRLNVGGRPTPDFLTYLSFENKFPISNAQSPYKKVREHKAQLTLVKDVTPWLGLSLSGYVTFAGRNTGQDVAIIPGVWLRFPDALGRSSGAERGDSPLPPGAAGTR